MLDHERPYAGGPPGWISPYPPGHADPITAAFTAVLQRWFEAIEQGTAEYAQPDMRSPYQWDDAQLEQLVTELDSYYEGQVRTGSRAFWFADAGPGFHRLAPAQRLAMAQELKVALDGNPQP